MELVTQASFAYRVYVPISLRYVILYFKNLKISYADVLSIFGFFVFLCISNQLVSGVMLALSYIAEPMFVPLVREEEGVEDLYVEDFFWIHERGVDLVFIFVFLHLFRKFYIIINDLEQENSWKSGSFSFLIIQVVVFLGLVLCCTHLSEITLTIAANVLHTFFLFISKVYWWAFTDRLLNSDTILRLMYGHYITAIFLFFLGLIHGIDMHYDWKNETNNKFIKQETVWWEEFFIFEIGKFLEKILIIGFFFFYFYEEPESLNYEIFMWGDVGVISDIRFYGVAPHWYFRPYMAWLIACPYHFIGIFGLIYFFMSIYYQTTIFNILKYNFFKILKTSIFKLFNIMKNFFLQYDQKILILNLYWNFTYFIFMVSIACSLSYLPYGRFYNRLGGNFSMLSAYIFIFSYLGFVFFRYIWFLSIIYLNNLN